mmetsp:Transcript_21288/g.49292  ORF Transcript_21288/g.49292 Transcript_21288/m.49292 type:complete len:207 (+) Transcript_21288:799-1419(+)
MVHLGKQLRLQRLHLLLLLLLLYSAPIIIIGGPTGQDAVIHPFSNGMNVNRRGRGLPRRADRGGPRRNGYTFGFVVVVVVVILLWLLRLKIVLQLGTQVQGSQGGLRRDKYGVPTGSEQRYQSIQHDLVTIGRQGHDDDFIVADQVVKRSGHAARKGRGRRRIMVVVVVVTPSCKWHRFRCAPWPPIGPSIFMERDPRGSRVWSLG